MSLEDLQFVMFDLAGTTVDDCVQGTPLMILAMRKACLQHGLELTPEQIVPHRGKQKKEAIRVLIQEVGAPDFPSSEAMVEAIHADFVRELNAHLAYVKPMPGAVETFRFLKSRGIYVGVGSGFPMRIVEQLVAHLRWTSQGLVDYVGSAELVGTGRPDPKMIQDAMQTLGVLDPRRVMKVGDTVVDVEEGQNAGVWTVAVLTGSQSVETLRYVGPDYLLASVIELPQLLSG